MAETARFEELLVKRRSVISAQNVSACRVPFRTLLIQAYLGLLLASCAPVAHPPYYRPLYPDPGARVARLPCGENPPEVLVLPGPKRLELAIRIRRGPAGGLGGAFYLNLRESIAVEFTSNAFVFEDMRSGAQATWRSPTVGLLRLRQPPPSWASTIWFAYWHKLGTSAVETQALSERTKIVGGFRIVSLTPSDFSPDRFRLYLPPMKIDEVDFQPQPVEFEYRTDDWGFVSLNC